MYCSIDTLIFEIVVLQLLNALNQSQLSYQFSRSDAYFVIDSFVKVGRSNGLGENPPAGLSSV